MFVKFKKFILLSIIIMPMMMAQIGHAQTFDNIDRTKFELTSSKVKITDVIDGETLIADGKDIIHLPAIYIPWETAMEKGQYHAAAKKYLEDNFKDQFVRIYQTKNPNGGQTNALGHQEGYVVRIEDNAFAQAALVQAGLAFAYPTQSHNDMMVPIYQAEISARNNKVGLWTDEDAMWGVMTPEQANNEANMNRFAVVEGQVRAVASRNNVIYLNFGDDWRTDFTVAMDGGLRRAFSKRDIDVMGMGNKIIRARGYLRSYNGGFLEVFDPSQIEVIK